MPITVLTHSRVQKHTRTGLPDRKAAHQYGKENRDDVAAGEDVASARIHRAVGDQRGAIPEREAVREKHDHHDEA